MKQRLEILLAMQDDDFKQILANDKIIEQLEKQKYNPQVEYWQLMQVLSGKSALGDVIFKPFTLALWSFLYSIKNPFVIGGDIQNKDVDLVLYLLHHGFSGLSQKIFADSKDFCIKNDLDYLQARVYILQMINLSFRPFEMLPNHGGGQKPKFNLEWLISMCSIVYKQSGCDRFYILYQMSMIQAFYYVICCMKQNDVKNQIKRRNSDQINAQIYKRTYELGQIYYKTKYKDL